MPQLGCTFLNCSHHFFFGHGSSPIKKPPVSGWLSFFEFGFAKDYFLLKTSKERNGLLAKSE
jgi:hypothetical protein